MENTPTVPNNELEQRYIRYKDVIKELTIMNDLLVLLKKKQQEEYRLWLLVIFQI